MEFFEKIRLSIGKFLLARKLKKTKRKKYYSNIQDVRKIGIVWDTSRPNEFSTLSKFHQKMNSRGIEVMIIGYYSDNNLPDQYTALRYLNFIRRHELNIFYIPVSPDSKSFITSHMDVLIDINLSKVFPLQYVLELSDAGFKVGLLESTAQDSPLDMLMDINPPVDLDNYLTQIVEYLEMINAKKT
jgi:hypothetical protein